MNTLITEDFKGFVFDVVKRNEKMIVKKKKLEVDLLPEFAEVFNKTDIYSSDYPF